MPLNYTGLYGILCNARGPSASANHRGSALILIMNNPIGEGLLAFESALRRLDDALAPYAEVHGDVFRETQSWRDLLTYKLVPHMAGEGCLVAAISGGTNTGKSTVFNLLLGRSASPMASTAAATCHPVLAANARRRAESLEAKLVPEFSPRPLEDPRSVVDPELPAEALFVVLDDSLPDHLVLMDTPDVDSIMRRNWEVAAHLRAAGDVMIAVITGEKYKDDRVVEFFRQAVAAARVVVPVMNKANPAEDYAVARRQIEDFCRDVGVEGPAFVIPHDFDIGEDLRRPIRSLDGSRDLKSYLASLDVPAIKSRVYEGTVSRFIEDADAFLEHLDRVAEPLRDVVASFADLTAHAAREYDPAPGRDVGGLFHEYVQARRGPIRRTIGSASATVVRGAGAVGRAIRGTIVRRATLEAKSVKPSAAEEALRELHRESIERITRDLISECADRARALGSPAREIVGDRFAQLDAGAVCNAVTAEVLQPGPLSEAFKQHARKLLDAWWEDHKGRRRALEALDAVLAVMPAAIAAPIAMHTGGLGAAEAAVLVGPVAAQFVTRVMEYQFGDALFDFISPWKKEQQARLRDALSRHVVDEGLGPLRTALDAMQRGPADAMRSALDACRNR